MIKDGELKTVNQKVERAAQGIITLHLKIEGFSINITYLGLLATPGYPMTSSAARMRISWSGLIVQGSPLRLTLSHILSNLVVQTTKAGLFEQQWASLTRQFTEEVKYRSGRASYMCGTVVFNVDGRTHHTNGMQKEGKVE